MTEVVQCIAVHRNDGAVALHLILEDVGADQQRLLERKPVKIATVGLANKTARIAWAVMARKEVYAAAAA